MRVVFVRLCDWGEVFGYGEARRLTVKCTYGNSLYRARLVSRATHIIRSSRHLQRAAHHTSLISRSPNIAPPSHPISALSLHPPCALACAHQSNAGGAGACLSAMPPLMARGTVGDSQAVAPAAVNGCSGSGAPETCATPIEALPEACRRSGRIEVCAPFSMMKIAGSAHLRASSRAPRARRPSLSRLATEALVIRACSSTSFSFASSCAQPTDPGGAVEDDITALRGCTW